jgi:beta-galactosidase
MNGMSLSRRNFVKGGMLAFTATSMPLLASATQPTVLAGESTAQRLDHGWEYYQGPLDARFELWPREDLVVWQPVTLPHCFNHYDACDPDTPAYRGPGWYRTMLPVHNPYPGGRTLLHFEAAGQSAAIYVGAQLVGQHNGGYDEFMVDITDAAGALPRVPLSVLCDNGRDAERMPSDMSDFTLYGGLYRHVHLVYVPAVSLEAVHSPVEFEPGASSARVKVTARLYAPKPADRNVRGDVRILSPQGDVLHQQQFERRAWTGEQAIFECDLAGPKLWSPAEPNLYRCEVTLRYGPDVSASAHDFGVRHTRWEDHGPFFLNGQRLALRGTQRHEDHAHYAAAMPDDLIREELRLVKAMGANFLRLAHYQQSRLVLELCDQLGILVWEEVPWCRSGIISELFKQRGKQQLRTMIDQHSNHPCVLLWGLGNEDDWPDETGGVDHAAIRNYMTELRELAHAQDPSRLTSYRRCDFARDIPDVYSPSIWAGWYSGTYREYRDALEKARPTVKHLIHMEWGADSHAGRHAEDPEPALAHIVPGGSTAETGFDYKLTGGATRVAKDGEWSETYACDLFDWYLKTLEELPWLTGAAQWVFKDFTTPLRVENPVPRVNEKGLLTRDMTPKEGYYVFQSYWATQPMLRVYGHTWPVRWGSDGQKRMVRVYSNCAAVELFLNGTSCGMKRRDPKDFPCAGLRWMLPFRAGENQLHAISRDPGLVLEDAVSFRYETRQPGTPHTFHLTATGGNTSALTVVEAVLLDAQGVRCVHSRAPVRFSLAGAGRLLDNLGTPTGSRLVQMYNGRAEITVEHFGPVTVAVSTEGEANGNLQQQLPLLANS